MPLTAVFATIQITLASSKDLDIVPVLWNQAVIEQKNCRLEEANNIFKVAETLIDKSSSPNKDCLRLVNQKLKYQQQVTTTCSTNVAKQQ